MPETLHPSANRNPGLRLVTCLFLASLPGLVPAQDRQTGLPPTPVLMAAFGSAPDLDPRLVEAAMQLHAARRAAVAAAAEALLRTPEIPPGPAGHALAGLLRSAHLRPPPPAADPDFDGDGLSPADVRRLLAHDFATEVLGQTTAARRLTEAVRRSDDPVDLSRQAPRCAVDAWGRVRCRDARGTTFLVAAPEPRVTRRVKGAPLGTDRHWLALTFADSARTAVLDDLRGARRLAPDGTTLVEFAAGRMMVSDPQACAPHPPHLALLDPDGDTLGLVTTHGTLLPPPRERARAAAWLDRAAQVLPDPAHLDLIAQYFVAYAPDPPDPRHPAIPGTPDWQGDVRDRPAETFATVRGGVCRADCDDLAGILVELMRRQGRPAFHFGPPGHVMAMTAEVDDGGEATLTLLHTGAPQIDRGPSLQEVVGRAVRRLDELLPFDPDQVPVWVRSDDDPWPSPAWIDHRALLGFDAALDAERLEIELARGALQAASRRLGPEEPDEDPSVLGRRAWIHAEHCRPARALETQDRAIALQRHPVSRFWSRLRSLGFAARAGASGSDLEDRLDQLFAEREGLRDLLSPLQHDNIALSIASSSLDRDRAELSAAAALRGAMPLLRGKVDPATRRLQDAAAVTVGQALREQPRAAGVASGPRGEQLMAALADWAERSADHDPERLARDARLIGLLFRARHGADALRANCFPELATERSPSSSKPVLDASIRTLLRADPSFWLEELRTLVRTSAPADELGLAGQAVDRATPLGDSAAAMFLLTALGSSDLTTARNLLPELLDSPHPTPTDLLTDLAVRGLPSAELAELAVAYARAGAEPTAVLALLRSWRCRDRDDAARAGARALQAIERDLSHTFPKDLAPEFAELAGLR